jgi:hypothetical protein
VQAVTQKIVSYIYSTQALTHPFLENSARSSAYDEDASKLANEYGKKVP